MNSRFPFHWLLLALLLIPVTAVAAAVIASPTWRLHRQKCALMREIHDRSGLIRVERSGPDWMRPLGAYYENGPAHSEPIGVYDSVVEVRLIKADVTDDLLARLAEFPNLKILNISQNDVTGEGLKHLTAFAHLEDLDLSYTKVSDDDMATLSDIPSLRRLDLSHNRLSGRGFRGLAALENLETICLVKTPLRGDALKSLAELPRLSTCNIFGCRHLTRENVETFQKRNPECRLFGVNSIAPFWEEAGGSEN